MLSYAKDLEALDGAVTSGGMPSMQIPGQMPGQFQGGMPGQNQGMQNPFDMGFGTAPSMNFGGAFNNSKQFR